jgi:hypothetical protein
MRDEKSSVARIDMAAAELGALRSEASRVAMAGAGVASSAPRPEVFGIELASSLLIAALSQNASSEGVERPAKVETLLLRDTASTPS